MVRLHMLTVLNVRTEGGAYVGGRDGLVKHYTLVNGQYMLASTQSFGLGSVLAILTLPFISRVAILCGMN